MKTGPFVLFIFGQEKKKNPKTTVLQAYRAAGPTDLNWM